MPHSHTPEPQITIACWEGPLSQLAAYLDESPASLKNRLGRHALKRSNGYHLEVRSDAALRAAVRILMSEEGL